MSIPINIHNNNSLLPNDCNVRTVGCRTTISKGNQVLTSIKDTFYTDSTDFTDSTEEKVYQIYSKIVSISNKNHDDMIQPILPEEGSKLNKDHMFSRLGLFFLQSLAYKGLQTTISRGNTDLTLDRKEKFEGAHHSLTGSITDTFKSELINNFNTAVQETNFSKLKNVLLNLIELGINPNCIESLLRSGPSDSERESELSALLMRTNGKLDSIIGIQYSNTPRLDLDSDFYLNNPTLTPSSPNYEFEDLFNVLGILPPKENDIKNILKVKSNLNRFILEINKAKREKLTTLGMTPDEITQSMDTERTVNDRKVILDNFLKKVPHRPLSFSNLHVALNTTLVAYPILNRIDDLYETQRIRHPSSGGVVNSKKFAVELLNEASHDRISSHEATNRLIGFMENLHSKIVTPLDRIKDEIETIYNSTTEDNFSIEKTLNSINKIIDYTEEYDGLFKNKPKLKKDLYTYKGIIEKQIKDLNNKTLSEVGKLESQKNEAINNREALIEQRNNVTSPISREISSLESQIENDRPLAIRDAKPKVKKAAELRILENSRRIKGLKLKGKQEFSPEKSRLSTEINGLNEQINLLNVDIAKAKKIDRYIINTQKWAETTQKFISPIKKQFNITVGILNDQNEGLKEFKTFFTHKPSGCPIKEKSIQNRMLKDRVHVSCSTLPLSMNDSQWDTFAEHQLRPLFNNLISACT
jgi:hypothetical protein